MTVQTFYLTDGDSDLVNGTLTNPDNMMVDDSNYSTLSLSGAGVNEVFLYKPNLYGIERGATINSVKVKAVYKFGSASGSADIGIYSLKEWEYTNTFWDGFENDCPTTDTVIEYTDARSFTLKELDEITVSLMWDSYSGGPTQLNIKYIAVEVDYTNPEKQQGYLEEFNSTSMSFDTAIPTGTDIKHVSFSRHAVPYVAVAFDSSPGIHVYKKGTTQWEKLADPSVTPHSMGSVYNVEWAGDYLIVTISASPRVIAYKLNTSNNTLIKIANPAGANVVPDESVFSLATSPDGNWIALGLGGVSAGVGTYGCMMQIISDVWTRVTMPDFPSDVGWGGIGWNVSFGGDSDKFFLCNGVWPYRHFYNLSNGTWSESTDDGIWDVPSSTVIYGSVNKSVDLLVSSLYSMSPATTIHYRDDTSSTTWWTPLVFGNIEPAVNDEALYVKMSDNKDKMYAVSYVNSSYVIQEYYVRGYTVEYLGTIGNDMTSGPLSISTSHDSRFIVFGSGDDLYLFESDFYKTATSTITISSGDQESIYLNKNIDTVYQTENIGYNNNISSNKNIGLDNISSSIGDTFTSAQNKMTYIEISDISSGDNTSSEGVKNILNNLNIQVGSVESCVNIKSIDISLSSTSLGDRFSVDWIYKVEGALSEYVGVNVAAIVSKTLTDDFGESLGFDVSGIYRKKISVPLQNISTGDNILSENAKYIDMELNVTIGDIEEINHNKTSYSDVICSEGGSVSIEYSLLQSASSVIEISLGESLNVSSVKISYVDSSISEGYNSYIEETKNTSMLLVDSIGDASVISSYKSLENLLNVSQGENIAINVLKSISQELNKTIGYNSDINFIIQKSADFEIMEGDQIVIEAISIYSDSVHESIGISQDVSFDKNTNVIVVNSEGIDESYDWTKKVIDSVQETTGVQLGTVHKQNSYFNIRKISLVGTKKPKYEIEGVKRQKIEIEVIYGD